MNGLSTTEELVDRHANLASRGMGNCRAAQALKKEITRRRLESQSAFLGNDDNHYNPEEHRDHGKWTAGPNVPGSPKNSPSQSPKAETSKEETYAITTSTTAALGDLLDRAGKAARDLIYARIFFALGDFEDAAKQLGITSDQLKQWGWPETVEEDSGTTGGKPSEQGMDMLSPPARAVATAADGVVESIPRMAIAEADPLLGIYGFGATRDGFDYRQAALTAFLPMIGKCSGDITQTIATKAGVSNEFAQQIFNKMGGAAGMASFIGADELDRIRNLPPEKQKEALVQASATMGVLFILGMLSHGKSSEPEQPGGDQPGNNAGTEKPTAESDPSQQKAGLTGSAEAAETVVLKPYVKPGGGHHIPAKAAFEGHPNYDPNEALAIPNDELARLGADHQVISATQQRLYRAFVKTGQKLTWDVIEKIETDALISGKIKPATAEATVKRAISALKARGVGGPTRTPWGG